MRIATLLLSLAGLAMPLLAQDTAKISVRTLAVTAGDFPKVWALDGTKPLALTFSAVQPSETNHITTDKTLALYQGELDDKGKRKDSAPTQLKLPAGNDILLLAWMQEGKVKFLPVPDGTPAGKRSDWRVINMTRKSVGIQVGKVQPVVFPSVSSLPLPIDSSVRDTAPIVMAANDNGTWNKFYSTYWPIPTDKRCLIVIVQIGENIEAKQILEDLERKAPKEDKQP